MFSLRVLGMQRLSHIHSNSSTALSSIALCDFCVTASGLHLFAGLGLFDCSTSETRASHGVKRPKRSGASHRFNATRSMTRTAICHLQPKDSRKSPEIRRASPDCLHALRA